MKQNRDAEAQYAELASALRVTGFEWVVEEVEEAAAQGKQVPFGSLEISEQHQYKTRLDRERLKGLRVGRAKPTDEIGAELSPGERLHMLADAAERVISTSALAHSYVVRFADEHELMSITLMPPPRTVPTVEAESAKEVTMEPRDDISQSLTLLRRTLRNEVLE